LPGPPGNQEEAGKKFKKLAVAFRESYGYLGAFPEVSWKKLTGGEDEKVV
jgi:hypothetical protein